MVCNDFKGGIGTSSRRLSEKFGGYTIGVLVQCNYGSRSQLRIAGVPVGSEISDHTTRDDDIGSIIVVVATDAPLIPTQLRRIAKRVPLGLGRLGSFSGNGSGDLFFAFSTGNPGAAESKGVRKLSMLPNDSLDPLFLATVQATEEAIVNAMKHGNQMDRNKTVRIAYSVGPDRFDCLVADEGPGFEPADVPDPTAAENLERPCGRGLMLMRHYMTAVEYNDRGNAVSMCKLRNGTPP